MHPLSEAQKQSCCAESGTFKVPLVAMHMRSEAAPAAPKAQQQPQSDWSRMSGERRMNGGNSVESTGLLGDRKERRDSGVQKKKTKQNKYHRVSAVFLTCYGLSAFRPERRTIKRVWWSWKTVKIRLGY